MKRPARLLVLAALLCGAAAVLSPAAASYAAQPGIQLSVDGAAFGSSADGPLLDIERLVPGEATSATLGVRSRMPELSTLHLRLHDVADDDNGCGQPERAVDKTCGDGEGDLGRTLRFSIANAKDRNGPYATTWTGTVALLERDVDAGVRLLPGDERWIRFRAVLPGSTGAAVESDTFGFALTVSLVGAGGTSHVEAIGTHRGDTHHGSASGSGTDSASSSPLASTGVAVALYVTAGVLLIAAGACLILAARRRRATTLG